MEFSSIFLIAILGFGLSISISGRKSAFISYEQSPFDVPYYNAAEDGEMNSNQAYISSAWKASYRPPFFSNEQTSIGVRPYYGAIGEDETNEVQVADLLPFISKAQNSFDVTSYGAVGDGKTNDAKAFDSAWKAACQAKSDSVTIVVPGGKDFLLSPIEFNGPCNSPKVYFMLLGNLVAPTKNSWGGQYSLEQWLSFNGINWLTFDGDDCKGKIDGQGYTWWKKDSNYSKRPSALRFSNCNNLVVKGTNHKNSPRNHISITNCNNVDVSNLVLEAPEDSPNTDGIDLSNSNTVFIRNSYMATGDDCIALNGGVSNIIISNIKCGPGHGISIGSLGKDGKHDEVLDIIVSDSNFTKSDNGVRIKTWQGGSGYVRNVTFSNINFEETNNPVIIDQYYCINKESCSEQSSAVQIIDVKFLKLRGTSIGKEGSVILNCSRSVPCKDIILDDIDIRPAGPKYPNKASCINVNGQARNVANPPLNCL